MTTLTTQAVDRPEYVDGHCHFDLFPDPRSAVGLAEKLRIHTIAVTNAPFVFRNTEQLATGSAFVRPAVGLHPELVKDQAKNLAQMWPVLERTRFVGEIGLDYAVGDRGDHERQRAVFSSILERCAAFGDKVLTIHSRRAAKDVLAAVGPRFPGTVILHWFSGTEKELEAAIAHGCYFSVNVAMTMSRTGARHLSLMPRDRVITESDGPFVQDDRRQSGPLTIVNTVSSLARVWRIPQEEAARLILENFFACTGVGTR
jgi:TatD DNase family protein